MYDAVLKQYVRCVQVTSRLASLWGKCTRKRTSSAFCITVVHFHFCFFPFLGRDQCFTQVFPKQFMAQHFVKRGTTTPGTTGTTGTTFNRRSPSIFAVLAVQQCRQPLPPQCLAGTGQCSRIGLHRRVHWFATVDRRPGRVPHGRQCSGRPTRQGEGRPRRAHPGQGRRRRAVRSRGAG